MIREPQIVETTSQLTACIQITVPREDLRRVIDPALAEIAAALDAQGIFPSGPWFTHHFRIVPDIFEFEICIPVESRITRAGRVSPGEWPAMTVARTIYEGPYGRLGAAWAEFNDWIASSGHKPDDDLFERYILGPGSISRTELSRALTIRASGS
jgi:effector-binding domain-containing protein